MRRFSILSLVCLLSSVTLAAPPKKEPPKPPTTLPPAGTTAVVAKPKALSLVRVNVTGQNYDYFRPWQKKASFSKRGLGAVLAKGRVLVTADLVTNQNYVELERAESGDKSAATVDVIDYEANLALLEPADPHFLDGLAPLEITNDTVVGDRVAAWQLEQTGALAITEGLVTSVQMIRYPVEVGQFLAYRVSISMQYRENSYTVPLVKGNKLAGVLLRYDPRSQILDAIPAPVIQHFLKDANSGHHYCGFPWGGFSFFPTRDPELRAFAGQTGKPGGVYVTSVDPSSPAQKGGLQVGDIVTSIKNNEIDQNGNYVDPLYGKIEITNLLSSAFCGDTLPLQIQRAGKPMTINITVDHRSPKDYVIPPYSEGQAPSYYVLGGLIFQELSRQYLREWGGNWQKEAPPRFVYFDRFQSELFPEGNRRVVILSQVLPSTGTIGYDDLAYLTVTKVNGKEIKSLADLAEAVEHPIDGFIKIETQEDPKQLELDVKQVDEEAPALQRNYGITAPERLER